MLHVALRAMEHHPKSANQELILQISADIVPDGVGCEAFNPKMEVVVHEVEGKRRQYRNCFMMRLGMVSDRWTY